MNGKIFIIEDEPSIIQLVQHNLEKEGFIVSSSENGNEGLKQLKKFDLMKKLVKSENIKILDSVGYFEMLELMKKSSFILTDSGGIQEEATAAQIRKKTFVIRKTTDRPEAIEHGFSELIGTSSKKLKLVLKNGYDSKIPNKKSPYGDGNASEKILKEIYNRF